MFISAVIIALAAESILFSQAYSTSSTPAPFASPRIGLIEPVGYVEGPYLQALLATCDQIRVNRALTCNAADLQRAEVVVYAARGQTIVKFRHVGRWHTATATYFVDPKTLSVSHAPPAM